MPKQLWGKWTVKRVIPTRTISCWDNHQAKKLLGTEIEFRTGLFRWNQVKVRSFMVENQALTAEEFAREYSGSQSFVSLKDLGIHGSAVTRVTIVHDAAPLDGTPQIPGDEALLKSHDVVVFPVCGVFFEARRVATSPHTRRTVK